MKNQKYQFLKGLRTLLVSVTKTPTVSVPSAKPTEESREAFRKGDYQKDLRLKELADIEMKRSKV